MSFEICPIHVTTKCNLPLNLRAVEHSDQERKKVNAVRISARRRRAPFLLVLTLLSAAGLTVLTPASPAHADPDCASVYAVFARGTGEHFNDLQAHDFYWYMKWAVEGTAASDGSHLTFAWSELGNEDGGVPVDMTTGPNYENQPKPGPDAPDEYPATGAMVSLDPPQVVLYDKSVTIGANELVTHLNNRVAKCPQESIVLGGYSQGADVVGWVLQRSDLSQTVRNHVGFVALYGDPKFDPGALSQREQWQRPWWVRGDDPGFRFTSTTGVVVPNNGAMFPRQPYVSSQFQGRFGSWCAYQDGICTGAASDHPWDLGTHGNAYQDHKNSDGSWYTGWVSRSVPEIANKAAQMRNQLNPQLLPATGPSYSIPGPDPNTDPPITSTPPPPPTILQVKRTLAPDGTTHEVYAATNSTVTEGWWHPGGDGVHTDQIINISQNNIVGFDKVNMPDGATQAIYTAVPDGVWESWWRSGTGVSSSKIVSGLSGVRQVIVANAYEGSQFVHRLYLLAQDGPYEVWWKDGGDGVHVDRLNNITGGVAMAAGTGPDGAYEVFVATPTWVYELWWFPGGTVNARTILNITQGDILSLSMGANLSDGTQLLYTGTSTTCWQSAWVGDNGSVSTGTITVGQTNAGEIEKDVYNGMHEIYQTNGGRVQENYWSSAGSGSDTLITISQNNISSFDKSDDGAYQQVYTASGNLVYETYWSAGVGPTSDVLYSVTS